MSVSRIIAGGIACIIGLTISCAPDGDIAKERTTTAQPGKGNGDKAREEKTVPPVDRPGPNNFEVTSASFSPDGKRFVVAFQQTSGLYTGPKWKMWDVESGKEIRTNWPNYEFKKKYPNVYSVAYLPDGKRILTMEFPNTWRMWDAEKIELLREFTPAGRPLFTADRSKYLMIGEKTGSLGICELETGKCIPHAVEIDKHLYPALVSPDARWAVFRGGAYEFASYDLQNNKRIHYAKDFFKKSDLEKKEGFLYPEISSRDGKTVLASRITGVDTSGVALCDAVTLKVIKEIPDVKRVIMAAFTPAGDKLLIHDEGYPPRLRCWDPKSNQLLWTIAHVREPPQPHLLVPSPKGDLILLVNGVLVGGGTLNTRPKARMVLLSAKTGEIVSRINADVFPQEDFADPNSEK